MRPLIVFSILLFIMSCSGQESATSEVENLVREPVAYSFNDEPFFEPRRSSQAQEELERNLKTSLQRLRKDSSEMNYIWWGRRLAYLSRYPEAIKAFSQGLKVYPNSYRLYRHRGHRYISTRELDLAITDFIKASELMPTDTVEVEPDGMPNKLNIPLSSTQFNVWYHLGLAYYLKADYEKALAAYLSCMEVSENDDLTVATTDWLYMTYQRLGDFKRAETLLNELADTLTIIENDSYRKRLKMYAGKFTPNQVLSLDSTSADYDLSLATQGYGVANYFLSQGDTARAKTLLQKILDGRHWSAFGYIAAEADLVRLLKSE